MPAARLWPLGCREGRGSHSCRRQRRLVVDRSHRTPAEVALVVLALVLVFTVSVGVIA